MAGQPKPAFYAVLALVVVGLIAFAVYRADIFAPGGDGGEKKNDEKIELTQTLEAPDGGGSPTTLKEYVRKESERLPDVVGTSDYKFNNNTVRFALNVWAGWAPIIYANNGFSPEKVWKTPDGEEFKVELVLIDNPIDMRNSYAAGDVQIGWATLDMVPLFVDGFVDASGKPKDSRVMPRIFQQVDWSNGGDGIVVRDSIKTVKDLKGKKIALAENSPSHYFLLNMLVSGGLQPSQVKMEFYGDAFQAAAAFNGEPSLSAAVSWAPDIYNLSEVKGNRMLVTTETANKLIADVWFARADFAKDHPGICEAIVRGIFDAMTDLKKEANKEAAAKLMETGYNLKPGDGLAMMGDAHSTNWAENYQFFVNQNNPTNFRRTWEQAYYLYRHSQVRAIRNQPVPYYQVMDDSIIKKLANEEKYASQRDEYQINLVPKTTSEIRGGGAEEVLTNTIVIHFYPNSADLYKKITKDKDGKTVEEMYDPNVKSVIEEVGQLAGRLSNSRVIIEGHTDSSMKGKVPEEMVRELSLNRANAVKQAVIREFDSMDPNRFNVEGYGWDFPADPDDPLNQSLNRRVEVKIYTAEATE
jgi:ABC-type nitrate/sulfonate/bicarbonate transport system substrate-binding protein/outer membrane protein OmpA-like peptidoglycan-associated protein